MKLDLELKISALLMHQMAILRMFSREWRCCVLLTVSAFTLIGAQRVYSDDVADVAQRMREARDRLLHLPSGFILDYRIDVEHDPERPAFTFFEGADGVFGVKWPQLYCRVEGNIYVTEVTAGIPQRIVARTVREGDYNFETKAGAGREGDELVQITDYRHAFSTSCHPIRFQYLEEADQRYFPGEVLKSDRFLPTALLQHDFEIIGSERVASVSCVVLARGQLDKIWVAPNHSYVVCRRERRSPTTGKLLERLEATDLREISSGVWFPMVQVQETFYKDTGEPRRQLTLTVTRVVTEAVREDRLEITIPDEVHWFEDHTQGLYVAHAPEDVSHEEAVAIAAGSLDSPLFHGAARPIILGLVSLSLLITTTVLYRIHCRQLMS